MNWPTRLLFAALALAGIVYLTLQEREEEGQALSNLDHQIEGRRRRLQEGREWLSRHPSGVIGRYEGESAEAFISKLYFEGATRVEVQCLREDTECLDSDTLIVTLPDRKNEREKLLETFNREFMPAGGEHLKDLGQRYLEFWWD